MDHTGVTFQQTADGAALMAAYVAGLERGGAAYKVEDRHGVWLVTVTGY